MVLTQTAASFPIAYERDGTVLVMTAAGGSAKEYGPGAGAVVSPDGGRVAFVETTGGKVGIRVVRIGGSEQSWKLKTLPNGRVRGLSWSPDSSSLTFEHIFDEEGRTLYVWKIREERANGVFNVTDHAEPMNAAFDASGRRVYLLWKGSVRTIDLGTGSMGLVSMDGVLTGVPAGASLTGLCSVAASPGDFVFSAEFGEGERSSALFVFRSADRQSYRLTPVKVEARSPRPGTSPRMTLFEGGFEDGRWLASVSILGGDVTKLVKL